MKEETILAWHFVGDTLRDGRPVPNDGVWLEHNGPLFMCKNGLHASIDPFHALNYAPGPILCRVECSGKIIKDKDKLVCSKRRIIARLDATKGLRYFARMQAISVTHLWETPQIVLDYLMTGDESIQVTAWVAARAASEDAAGAAAEAAARAAARAASENAARAAAEAAAWAAARDAAWAAAGAAAEAAARAAAWADWNQLVNEAFEGVL